MMLRHRPMSRSLDSTRRRSGKAALVLLLALPTMLLAMAMAFYAAELVETRTLLRNDTDAAALAAVQTFVDDRLLLGDPNIVLQILNDPNNGVRANAQLYAELNLVFGQGLYLDPNVNNDPNGDIVVGTLLTPRSKTFLLPDLTKNSDPEWLSINAVRVTGRCDQRRPDGPVGLHNGPLLSRLPNDVAAVSTATLDRFVIGFRPMGLQPMPLCPLALFSYPPGNMRHCWEYNVEKRLGDDRFRVQRNGSIYQILGGADGLHEMEVFLGDGQNQNEGKNSGRDDRNAHLRQRRFNCCMLQFGSTRVQDLAQQVVNGVYGVQLSQWGGQLVLGAGNLLEVNGTPWGPRGGSRDCNLLQSALQWLQSTGEPRLWPCFSSFDPKTNNPVLCGFVAARVVAVYNGSGKGGGVRFSVQPCMMPTATAVTDVSRTGIGFAKLPNPYICKVRLVE
jgi:hypothetical protein